MDDTGVQIPWSGWHIVRELGEGGYGKVYEIERTQSGITERAALKVIRIPKNRSEYESVSFSMDTDEELQDFFDNKKDEVLGEIETMQSLKGSANIVSIEDWKVERNEEDSGWTIYIRMELLNTLQRKYNKTEIPEEEVIKIGTDICAALEQCAKKDFIHRDIKPSNILVSEHGDYKLADFGIARTLDHTTYVTGVGTPPYMAPEIYYGKSTDKTADLYSLGLVMYELLNNRRPPFISTEGKINPLELRNSTARRMNGEELPEPVRGSEELKQIVLKACSYEPEDRYRTAGAMKKALVFLLGETEEIVEQSIQSEPKDREIVRAGTEEWYEDEGTIGAESLIMSRPLREKQTIPTSEVKSLKEKEEGYTEDKYCEDWQEEETVKEILGNSFRIQKSLSKNGFDTKKLIGIVALILILAIIAVVPIISSKSSDTNHSSSEETYGGNDNEISASEAQEHNSDIVNNSNGSESGWVYFNTHSPIGVTYNKLLSEYSTMDYEFTYTGGCYYKVNQSDYYVGFPKNFPEEVTTEDVCCSVAGNLKTLFNTSGYYSKEDLESLLSLSKISEDAGEGGFTATTTGGDYYITFAMENMNGQLLSDDIWLYIIDNEIS